LTRNSIELTLESLVDLWSHQSQRSTHTNYLSDLLKSFRTFRPGKTAYFTDLQSGVKNFFLDPDQRRSDLVWRRVFYRAKVVCQPFFSAPRSALPVSSVARLNRRSPRKEPRIIRPSSSPSRPYAI